VPFGDPAEILFRGTGFTIVKMPVAGERLFQLPLRRLSHRVGVDCGDVCAWNIAAQVRIHAVFMLQDYN
jgi:hypothetical protein